MADIIRITAGCPDNPDCTFEGTDLFFEIAVENTSGEAIELPLAYLRASGVYVALINPVTGETHPVRRPVPRSDLLGETETLAPGETVKIDWLLTPFELTQFGRNVDLVANIDVLTDASIEGRPVEARGSNQLRIRVPAR